MFPQPILTVDKLKSKQYERCVPCTALFCYNGTKREGRIKMENKLAENIRTFRKQRALTQEQLAEVLGVTVGAVYKWEARPPGGGKALPFGIAR